eukprot:Pgem_evm1s5724
MNVSNIFLSKISVVCAMLIIFLANTSSGLVTLPVKLFVEKKIIAYALVAKIGTPGQEQDLQIDTGSFDIWTVSGDPMCKVYPVSGEGYSAEEVANASCTTSKTLYNYTSSTTAKVLNETYGNQGYGTDSQCTCTEFQNVARTPDLLPEKCPANDTRVFPCPFGGLTMEDIITAADGTVVPITFGAVTDMPPKQALLFIGKLGINVLEPFYCFDPNGDNAEYSSITFDGAVPDTYTGEFVQLNNPEYSFTNITQDVISFWYVNVVGFETSDGKVKLGAANATFPVLNINSTKTGKPYSFPLLNGKDIKQNFGIFDSGTPTFMVNKYIFDMVAEVYNIGDNIAAFLKSLPEDYYMALYLLKEDGSIVELKVGAKSLFNAETGEVYFVEGAQFIIGDVVLHNVVTNFDYLTSTV